ncbi:MAG: nucleotidyltransferase domain-containing protein [Nanoarchaeota archaeon]
MKKAVSKKKGLLSTKTGQQSQIVGQKDLMLEFFFEHPVASLTVRGLASETGIRRSTIQRHLKSLRKEGYLSKENRWADTWFNRIRKTDYFLEKFCASGLIGYLEEQLAASAIILFGSFRKGESAKESDIDLFVECAKEKELNLQPFEKLLGHKIQLFTRPKITLLPKHLLNNVVNGIKLKGYFTIK